MEPYSFSSLLLNTHVRSSLWQQTDFNHHKQKVRPSVNLETRLRIFEVLEIARDFNNKARNPHGNTAEANILCDSYNQLFHTAWRCADKKCAFIEICYSRKNGVCIRARMLTTIHRTCIIKGYTDLCSIKQIEFEKLFATDILCIFYLDLFRLPLQCTIHRRSSSLFIKVVCSITYTKAFMQTYRTTHLYLIYHKIPLL